MFKDMQEEEVSKMVEITGGVPVKLDERLRVMIDPNTLWNIKRGEVKMLPPRLSHWLRKKVQQGILIPVDNVRIIGRKVIAVSELKSEEIKPKKPNKGKPIKK